MASNQHRNLTGEQLHNPKGFDGASPSTTLIKNAAGEIEWRENTTFDNALDYVSPQSAPPTEVQDDIYLLDDTGVVYDIDTIAWQSGNTIRYTFNGTPNLSAITAGDYLVTSGNGNAVNDGTFIISAVDDGLDYIEITNALRSDATDDEASDAVGTAYYTLGEWDGASKGSHIKFDGTNWNSVNAQDGAICYDETSNSHRIYDAANTNWDTSLTTASGAGAAQISGTPVDNQIAVWTNSTTIEGDANLTWNAGLDMTATSQRGIDLTHNPSGTGTAIGNDIDLTGNSNTTTAYGFYSKVDTSLGGSAYGGWFRVLGSDGAAFGSYGSVEGSVGGAAYGAYNLIGIGGTDTSGGTMYGSQNIITISTSGTHGASMIGSSVDLNYNKVGGSITNAFGFYSTGIVCNDSGATITNAYGVYLGDNAGAGTITNSYGVYQDGADDQNYFAGNVGIGETSPQVKLHASGSGEIARLETSAGTGDNYFTFHDTAQKGLVGYESGSDNLVIENGEIGSSIIFKTAHTGAGGTTFNGLELDGTGDVTMAGVLTATGGIVSNGSLEVSSTTQALQLSRWTSSEQTTNTGSYGTTEKGELWFNTTTNNFTGWDGSSAVPLSSTESLIVAVSDESTALTTGTNKITFRMPYAFTLTEVRASLTTAGTTSGTTTVDINEAGVSILSTKLTIDFGEKTSTTAATAAVISDTALADDAEITVDIDAISGGATETGLKIYLIGNRT